MRFSNTLTIKAFLSLSMTLFLAACNLPNPKEKETTTNTAATFTAQPMPDRSKAIEAQVSGAFALPTSKVFNLQACLKDVAYDRIIAGHDFLIEDLNKTVTSDKAGCITWPEHVEFNFLGESQYIRLERTIRGLGLHKGTQKVAFAINPWSYGENLPAVLNPDDGNQIPNLVNDSQKATLALKGFAANNKLKSRPLWVEDGRMFVTEHKISSTGVDLAVELRPTTTIHLTKMNGEIYLYPLRSGSFKARLSLIHVYQQSGEEIRRLLAMSPEQYVSMDNGSLAVKSILTLKALPTRGQVQVGLQLEAVSGPAGLSSFDGVYYLGEYDQIKGAAFMRLNAIVAQTKNFKLENYINSTLTDVTRVVTPETTTATATPTSVSTEKANDKPKSEMPTEIVFDADAYQKPKIEVAPLEFRFIRVGNETTTKREVLYNIKACVRHGIDQRITRAHSFKVTKFRQNEGDKANSLTVKTDNNACINWDESISFNYFDCQRYIKGFVQIENADLGMNEKLEIIINPWESWGAVGRDMRYVDTTEKIVLTCTDENRPRTQMLIDGLSYNTLSYDYSVDSHLNLTVTKKMHVKIEPHLLLYSSLSNGRGEVGRLRDGVYLLKMAVVQNRDYNDQNTYVTSAEKLVNVMSGQVNTEITFQTQDLKALGNRNNLLVELYPVDESKVVLDGSQIRLKNGVPSLDSAIDTTTPLESPTFIGPITLNIDEATRPLRVMEPSAVNQFLLNGVGSNDSNGKYFINQVVSQGLQALSSKRQRIQARTEKTVYANENNLDLITLKNADEKAPLVKALVGSSSLGQNLIISKAELQDIIINGTLSAQTAHKLCAFWASDYFRKIHESKGGAIFKQSRTAFGMDCMTAIRRDPSRFFLTEKHLLIKDVGGSQYLKGFNQTLNVGTSFSMNTGRTTSKNTSKSVMAKAGLSKKIFDLISLGIDFSYSMSWTTSDSNSTSNAISVNTSTYLLVQHNIFKVRANSYEQCAIVRLNPSLFIKDPDAGWFSGRRDYINFVNPTLKEDEAADAVTRGIMLCEGIVRQVPLDLTEDYYLITQEASSSQMQDSGDARNRNFFVALRSKNDFNRFVVAIKGEAKMPGSYKKEEDPQTQMIKIMERLFGTTGPAYPGSYLMMN